MGKRLRCSTFIISRGEFCYKIGPAMRILRAAIILNALISVAAWGQSSPATGIQLSKPPEYRLEPISAGNAAYPAEAREEKIEGEAVATFFVSESGDVSLANVNGADPLLAAAVEAAVNKWKFRPVMRDGKPIPVFGRATFRFVLNDETQFANGVPGEIGAASDMPRRIRVSNAVTGGLLLKKVNPIYPDEARRNGIQGPVLLAATIESRGLNRQSAGFIRAARACTCRRGSCKAVAL